MKADDLGEFEDGIIGYVFYEKGEYVLKADGVIQQDLDEQGLEVVGNIYENKNLCK